MKAYFIILGGDITEDPISKILETKCFVTQTDALDFLEQNTCPDIEDDLIEVWEIDTLRYEKKVVWGFYGWHWSYTQKNQEQGCLNGHIESWYYELSKDY